MVAPIDDFCTCGHRARFHEGRRLLCVMAGCQTCKGFDLAPTKAGEPAEG
jgi:hypothetical protein